MAGDVAGGGYLPRAPDLSVLFPWLDLADHEAGIRVEERLGQVGPHRCPARRGAGRARAGKSSGRCGPGSRPRSNRGACSDQPSDANYVGPRKAASRSDAPLRCLVDKGGVVYLTADAMTST